jgi:sacsin
VKILLNTHSYGTRSLLDPRMADWQGPSLCVFNDAAFTERDFQNVARIGQASKLDKLGTTGRFGLGFNAVYHFTDLPQVPARESR